MKRWIGVIFLSFSVIGCWFLLTAGERSGVTENQFKTPPVCSGNESVGVKNDLLQFTAQGHVIGFRRDGIIMAAGDHAVRIEFVNGNNVEPVSESVVNGNEKGTPSLERVVYRNLWDHIDLIYEKTGQGVIKSSYLISTGGDPESIRLKYNGQVEINEKGELTVAYATGRLVEGKPVSWQEQRTGKKPVTSTYRKLGENEIGLFVSGWESSSTLVIDPISMWNTFLGGTSPDVGYGISFDGSGNVFVTGYSGATWGSPVNPYGGGDSDVFVAKLNPAGTLLWNTFLGGNDTDMGYGICVDGDGNAYVVGFSEAAWGTPLLPYHGGFHDALVAKLNANGILQWHTFLGGSDADVGGGICVSGSGNIYLTGQSYSTWGSPINPLGGVYDAFVVKLSSGGVLQWNTFLGGTSPDGGKGIKVDGSENLYVTGYSSSTWGTPVNVFAGTIDVFVAKLNAAGALQWNTFLGGSGKDWGLGIAIDGIGNIYVTGYSEAAWGSPVNPYAGGVSDAFAAKLNSSGALQWHTFSGGGSYDRGFGISVDTNGKIFLTGYSMSTWGSPMNPFIGDSDIFVARLNASGALQWNTFFGGSFSDTGYGICIDGSGSICVSGNSSSSWGSPVNPYVGSWDVFIARISSVLQITSPNGGEIWPLGSKRVITWESDGMQQNIKLVLFQNGVKVGNIATDLSSSSGSYAWTVGNYIGGSAASGTGYTVRVININGTCSDFSDAPFTIPPLNLVSPNGYENWQLGSVHPITWTAPGLSGTVKLVLFKDTVKIGNIATYLPASSGSYSWTIPSGTGAFGTGYWVRVITMNGVYRDESDAHFSITAQSQLRITSPDGGEVWPWHNFRAITWTKGSYTGNVKLVLFKNGVKLGNIVVDIPANSSPFNWGVGNYIGGAERSGEGYSIRVISMDGVQRDESDGPFVIQ